MDRPAIAGDSAQSDKSRPASRHRNARQLGRYSAHRREIQALGRILNRVADLARAQMALINAPAHGSPHHVEIAEQHVSRCMQRLLKAALVLDRVLVERGDEEGRQRFVEGARRLCASVCQSDPDSCSETKRSNGRCADPLCSRTAGRYSPHNAILHSD